MREQSSPRKDWRSFVLPSAISALTLGGVGFFCGFYVGPTYLNPSSNLAPIAGFLTGPLGALLGLGVGLWAVLRQAGLARYSVVLLLSAVFVAVGSLYVNLPRPAYRGFIIDAQTLSCQAPDSLVGEAITRAENINWISPRPDWREDVHRMLEVDKGVVLTMLVHRRREIREKRAPWNKGRLTASDWETVSAEERYFSRDAGPSCADYSSGDRSYFAPEWEVSGVSPPDILPTFFGLYVLEEVPLSFVSFVEVEAGV